MIKSEHTLASIESLYIYLNQGYTLKMHGSFRYPVYSGWKASTRQNHDLHLLYIRDGKGKYIMEDGDEIILEKGVFFMNTPGIMYRGEVEEEQPLEICGIRFGLYHLERHESKALVPFYCATVVQDYVHISYILTQLHNMFHSGKTPYKDIVCAAYLTELILNFLEGKNHKVHKTKESSLPIDQEITHIKELIDERANKVLRITDMARDKGISMRYLQKRFKLLYGITPKEYSMQITMDRAYTQISQGKLVKEVARDMGYSDMYAFSRQFKKHFGFSPSHTFKK